MGLLDYLKRTPDLPGTGTEDTISPTEEQGKDGRGKTDRERFEPIEVHPPLLAPVKMRKGYDPAEKVWTKPAGMSDEDWNSAISVFSPKRVNELYEGFDPDSSEPFYGRLYQSVHRKPEAPDEKKVSAARNIAALGDALSLVAQGIGAAKGSFIDLRQDDAVGRTNAGIERLNEVYKGERDRYDAGLLGSMVRDAEGARGAYAKDRASLLAYLAGLRKAKADNDYRDKKFQGEMVYRYEKMQKDAEAQKAKLKQGDRKLALDWHKADAKAKGSSGGSLKYVDFYNPNTGISYRVEQKKWDANFTQIFNRIKDDLYKKYPALARAERYAEGVKPEVKEEFVKQFMYDNPGALKFLNDIAELSYADGKAEQKPPVPLPPISRTQVAAIQGIVDQHKGNEKDALRATMMYLKEQGFKREEIEAIIRKMITD